MMNKFVFVAERHGIKVERAAFAAMSAARVGQFAQTKKLLGFEVLLLQSLCVGTALFHSRPLLALINRIG